jgi:hypothetical protein
MRKLALATGIAAGLNLVKPLSNLVETLRRMPGNGWGDVGWDAVAAAVLALAVVSVLFYFALYRDRGTLCLTPGLRQLGWLAAVGWGVLLTAELRANMGAWSVFEAADVLVTALSIALLIALLRGSGAEASEVTPVGALLHSTSAAMTAIYGLAVAAGLVGLAFLPYTYATMRDYSQQLGRTPPRVLDLMMQQLHGTAVQAVSLVLAFLVYCGARGSAARRMT